MKIEGIEPVEILHKLIELKAPEQVYDLEDQLETIQAQDMALIAKPKAKLLNKHIHS